MRVIFTGTREPVGYLGLWRERYGPSDFIPLGSLERIVKENHSGLTAEAIIVETTELYFFESAVDEEYLGRRRQTLNLENILSYSLS